MNNKIKISESGKYFVNDIEIDDSVFNDERIGYCIEEREELIDNLIDWISEARESDKNLMKDDLKMLIKRNEEFLFSSYSTNEYIFDGDDDFNSICEDILKLTDMKGGLEE